MKKILTIMASLLLTAIVVRSQAPGIFNYQGVARNSVGNALINKTITLRLTIHDATAGGATVYQETRTAITNPFGLFNVQVGSPGATNITGTIMGVNWGVNAKFIQVEIDPNGGSTFINIGTAQIVSVPYALVSLFASDLLLPYDKTQADNGTLFKITNSGNASGSTALEGLTNSTAANASAIIGTITSTTPGTNAAGVKGINNSTNGNGMGVFGSALSGVGVYGTSNTGRGGFFEVTNAASVADAIRAETNGAGASWAIRAISSGANGAGLFQQTNATNTANNLQSNQGGLGRAGLFNSTNTANTANAVEINVAGTGFGLRIASTNGTPKALQTAGGIQLTGINEALNRILASDAVGNATWKDPSAVGIISGSGTLNYVSKWTPNGTSLGNSQIFDNGTSVGINTNIPNAAYRLEVQGIQRINNTTLQEGGELRFQEGTLFGAPNHWIIDNFESFAGGNKFRIWNDVGGMNIQMLPNNKTAIGNMVFSDQPQSTLDVEGNLAVGTTYSGTNAAPANGMIVEGNVGIGIVLPTAKLHVFNNSATALNSLVVNQSNAANTAIGVNLLNVNTSSTGYGNGTVYAQRGTGSLGATYLYTGIATAITGVAASPVGFGVQGTSESGYGVTGLSYSGISVHGINLNSGNAARFENAINAGNIAPVVFVNNISTAGNVYGVHSIIASTAPGGSSTALRGQNNGLAGSGIGVWGSQDGSGWGVYGVTPNGLGVYGQGTNNGWGVEGVAFNGIGTFSFSQNWYGAWGETNSTNGGNTAGTLGYASNATSVGFTRGIWGYNNATNNDGAGGLFQHVSGGYGVYSAAGNLGMGVYGVAGTNGTGVFGESFGVNSRGVRGQSDLGFAGLFETTSTSSVNAALRVNDPDLTSGSSVFRKAGIYSELIPLAGGITRAAISTAIIGSSATSLVPGFGAGAGIQGVTRSGYGVIGNSIDGTALYGITWGGGYGLQTFGKSLMTGASGGATLELRDNSFVGQPHLLINESGNDYGRISLRNTDPVNSGNNFWDIAGYTNDTRAFERLNFYNNATGDLMSITGTGMVGIGTTNPQSRLHVVNVSEAIRSEVIYPAPVARIGANVFSSTNSQYSLLARHNANFSVNNPAANAAITGVDSTAGFISFGVAGYSIGTNTGTGTGVYGMAGKDLTFVSNPIWGTNYSGGQFWGADFGATGAVWDVVGANLVGISTTKIGVLGWVSYLNPGGTNVGIYSNGATGGATNYAGYFLGDVQVVGNFTATGVKAFHIDHPLDPANKYLNHFAVESPEVQNIYNGNAKTDANGKITVSLPDYFEAINTDFKYQLTIVDETQFAMARVSKKISGNSFEISTSVPNIEVSWQVTAIRNDKAVMKNAMSAVTEKLPSEKGKYLDPDLYGQPADKALLHVNTPTTGGNDKVSQAYDNKMMESFKTGKKEGNGTPGIVPSGKSEAVNAPSLPMISVTAEELQSEKQVKEAVNKNKADELKKILEQKPVVPENSKIKTDQGQKDIPAETKPVEIPAKLEAAPAKSN